MNQENLCYGCMREKGPAPVCPSCGWAENRNADSTLYLTPGTVLSKKYLVGKVLGQGGFGITYLGWDRNLDIRVAIKEYFPQGLVSRVPGENNVHSYTGPTKDQFSFGLDSFLREAKILARFEHHPNIVTVRDFFRENSTAYMVMSFIEGVTLLDYLKNKGERIPIDRAIEIMMPVLDALKGVHSAGIMHRDISPDNIFIDHEGRVILIDFGAARQEMREKSKSLSVILKAGYAPEEQYRSRGKQGPWTDIYAVAAAMYHAVTGVMPPESLDRMSEETLNPPSQLGVKIKPHLEQALLKAMALRSKDRYQTVEEFQKALISGEKGESEKEYTEAGPTRAGVWYKEPEYKQSGTVAEKLENAAVKAQVKDKNTFVVNKTTAVVGAIIITGLLLFGGFSLFTGETEEITAEADLELEEVDQNRDQLYDEEQRTRESDLKVITDGDYLLALVTKEITLKSSYSPTDLEPIPSYINPSYTMYLRSESLDQLEKLWQAAEEDGVIISIRSAYRSYETEKGIFQDYASMHGAEEANRFSARPGQSEHQLGTTVDFGGTKVDFSAEFFDTAQGRWLAHNAHRFGFAMSYPEGKEHITGYIFEPWHYRYIGADQALSWKESGLTLREYLETKPQSFE